MTEHRCCTSLAVVACPAGWAAARPCHRVAMSLVPTAAAQLAVSAEPAGWTHCQGKQGGTAGGSWSPGRAVSTDTARTPRVQVLNGMRGSAFCLPFSCCRSYHSGDGARGTLKSPACTPMSEEAEMCSVQPAVLSVAMPGQSLDAPLAEADAPAQLKYPHSS